MPKARVYELAKELGVDSKTVLSKLEAMGEFVKSASSTVEPPVARKLRNAFASSGQGNASDSKRPGHTAKKPVEPASHSMPKPAAPSAPKPAAPAAPKPHHAASKSDAPKPGHRAPRPGESRQHGNRPNGNAPRPQGGDRRQSGRRRPFRELAPSMATLRRAATTPMARSRTPRDRARATIRSAASRACTPRLRVIFRVRIR